MLAAPFRIGLALATLLAAVAGAALAGPAAPDAEAAIQQLRDCSVIEKAFDWDSGNREPTFDRSHLEKFFEPQTVPPALTLEARLGPDRPWRGFGEVRCARPDRLPARTLGFLTPWYSADGDLALVRIADGQKWRGYLMRRQGGRWVLEAERTLEAQYAPIDIEEVI